VDGAIGLCGRLGQNADEVEDGFRPHDRTADTCKTIIGWYDASASNFSTDQRRAKHFFDRVDADLVADQLRRMYPRLAQDIEVTAVQPTGLTFSSDAIAVLL
jgi:hypothetical protein